MLIEKIQFSFARKKFGRLCIFISIHIHCCFRPGPGSEAAVMKHINYVETELNQCQCQTRAELLMLC